MAQGDRFAIFLAGDRSGGPPCGVAIWRVLTAFQARRSAGRVTAAALSP